MEQHRRNTFMTVSAAVCMITAVCLISGKVSYVHNYRERPDFFKNLEICLDSVPEDGRVAANTWFLPHLADRPQIYLFDRNDFETDPGLAREGEDNFAETVTGLKDIHRYDFYVMSRRDENTGIAIPYLEEAGFVPYAEAEEYIIIYVSQEYLNSH